MSTLTLPPRRFARPDPMRAAINCELRRGHTVVTFARVSARRHKVLAVYHPWTRQ